MNKVALSVLLIGVAGLAATWWAAGLLATIAELTVEVALYVVVIRPWLRKKEWAKPFFAGAVTEWIELHLFRKSETLMWARWQMFIGPTITSLQSFGAIDITPLVTILTFVLPPKYQWLAQVIAQGWPMLFALLGAIGEFQRRDTTKPLELVAVPEAVKNDPAVVEAEASRETATGFAILEVEVAKEAEAKAA